MELRRLNAVFLVVAVALIDQGLKLAAQAFLPEVTHGVASAMVVVPQTVLLGLAWDPAFGFGLGNMLPEPLPFVLFGLVPIVVLVGLAIWHLRSSWRPPFPQILSLSLLLGGVLGNSLDRWFYGGRVANYLGLGFFSWSTPRDWYFTNLSDIAVVVGALLALWAFRKPATSQEPD